MNRNLIIPLVLLDTLAAVLLALHRRLVFARGRPVQAARRAQPRNADDHRRRGADVDCAPLMRRSVVASMRERGR